MSKYLTVEEAADRLGVEYKTVYRLVRSGDIPAGKVGRIYRIREDDLNAFFDQQKQHVAAQAGRTGLTALEGRRCGACGSSILSELSIGGTCEQCDRDICQACWAIRKMRRCSAHGEVEDDTSRVEQDRKSAATAPSPEPEHTNHSAVIERHRQEGRPVVTADEARLAEEAFIRAFAQRLEQIEELPDPLGSVAIPLRRARVKHSVGSTGRKSSEFPRNLISRFTLSFGGWGKPKAGLALEARFLSRADVLASNGYDAEPLGEVELTPLLNDLRTRAKKEDSFLVVSIGSPTGWDEPAIRVIAQRNHGRAFHDQSLGVALYDLHADEAHLDRDDERLWAFWPLLAPGEYAGEIARCVDKLEELVARYEHVALDYAVQECGGDVSWVRAAIEELKRSGKYEARERPNRGLVLSRPLA